jgi:hypothetical protein
MAIEILKVEKVISSRLKGDATLKTLMQVISGQEIRLYASAATEGQVRGLWITHDLISAPDTNVMGGDHVMSRPTYIIKVCNADLGYQACGEPLNRIDALLNGQEGEVVDGVYVGKFIRRNVVKSFDDEKGTRVFWVGITYLLMSYEINS